MSCVWKREFEGGGLSEAEADRPAIKSRSKHGQGEKTGNDKRVFYSLVQCTSTPVGRGLSWSCSERDHLFSNPPRIPQGLSLGSSLFFSSRWLWKSQTHSLPILAPDSLQFLTTDAFRLPHSRLFLVSVRSYVLFFSLTLLRSSLSLVDLHGIHIYMHIYIVCRICRLCIEYYSKII